jgi:excisionase family DNA binding protein
MGNSPCFLSEKEAAAYLSVSLSTIRRWRRRKTGPPLFQFGGVLRYDREALDVFIANYTRAA